jgi:hypothetical protein
MLLQQNPLGNPSGFFCLALFAADADEFAF